MMIKQKIIVLFRNFFNGLSTNIIKKINPHIKGNTKPKIQGIE